MKLTESKLREMVKSVLSEVEIMGSNIAFKKENDVPNLASEEKILLQAIRSETWTGDLQHMSKEEIGDSLIKIGNYVKEFGVEI